VEERDYDPRERIVTGEREQRAAAMMVGEVDRKAFLLGVERMLWRAIFDRERAYAALK
jgi:hypothetical protein